MISRQRNTATHILALRFRSSRPKTDQSHGDNARRNSTNGTSAAYRMPENLIMNPTPVRMDATPARAHVTRRPSSHSDHARASVEKLNAMSFLTRGAWARKFGSKANRMDATTAARGPAHCQDQHAMTAPSATPMINIILLDRPTIASPSFPAVRKRTSIGWGIAMGSTGRSGSARTAVQSTFNAVLEWGRAAQYSQSGGCSGSPRKSPRWRIIQPAMVWKGSSKVGLLVRTALQDRSEEHTP